MQVAFASKELSALITFSSSFPQITVSGRSFSEQRNQLTDRVCAMEYIVSDAPQKVECLRMRK